MRLLWLPRVCYVLFQVGKGVAARKMGEVAHGTKRHLAHFMLNYTR
jgi:hypothetical protein